MDAFRRCPLVLVAVACFISPSQGLGQLSEPDTDVSIKDGFAKSQIRYAQACLDLATVEYEAAMEAESSHSPAALQRLANSIKVAEEQLRVAKLPRSESDTVPVHLRYAEEKAKLAKRTYLGALERNKKRSGTYSELHLEQLRLKAEVAESRLAVWSNPAQILTYLDHIHWEIDRLGEAIIDLQQRQDRYEAR